MKAASIALLLLAVAGCFGGPLDRDPRVEVHAFSIAPTTLARGQKFEITWDIEHSGAPGNTMLFTLSGTGTDGQPKEVLSRGDGASRGRSRGKQSCTVTPSNTIACSPFGSDGPFALGPLKLTFEACDSYVLSDDQVCDQRTVDIVLTD